MVNVFLILDETVDKFNVHNHQEDFTEESIQMRQLYNVNMLILRYVIYTHFFRVYPFETPNF